ncbi:hypothetical protein BT69DRAFT_1279895 [Atractiella rhizophila]|nr:hypothetical protein BT69DRAFT_1279895 [Atractiella rhizophila]
MEGTLVKNRMGHSSNRRIELERGQAVELVVGPCQMSNSSTVHRRRIGCRRR